VGKRSRWLPWYCVQNDGGIRRPADEGAKVQHRSIEELIHRKYFSEQSIKEKKKGAKRNVIDSLKCLRQFRQSGKQRFLQIEKKTTYIYSKFIVQFESKETGLMSGATTKMSTGMKWTAPARQQFAR
jgi:hypothetical protein